MIDSLADASIGAVSRLAGLRGKSNEVVSPAHDHAGLLTLLLLIKKNFVLDASHQKYQFNNQKSKKNKKKRREKNRQRYSRTRRSLIGANSQVPRPETKC